MDHTPRVSIVTALYNHRRFLRRRFESIVNQTLTDFEWIIIDDCSTDGSYELVMELIQGDPRITVLRNDVNTGAMATKQRGIDLARGEYLYCVDSDDYCVSHFLARMIGILERNPAVALVHCRGFTMDEHDGYWGGWPRRKSYRQDGFSVFKCNLLQYQMKSSTIVYRNRWVQQLGSFWFLPTAGAWLTCGEDWFLSLCVCLMGEVVFIDEVLTYQRRHATNISNDFTRQLDAVRCEVDNFLVIDELIARVPARYADQVEDLRKAALGRMIRKQLRTIDRARAQGLNAEANELNALICKYACNLDFSQKERSRRPQLKQQCELIVGKLIKTLTYRRLPPLSDWTRDCNCGAIALATSTSPTRMTQPSRSSTAATPERD